MLHRPDPITIVAVPSFIVVLHMPKEVVSEI